MDAISSGIMLILIGILLGIISYKKYRPFWDFFNTKIIRRVLGEELTTITLYCLSSLFIIVGALLALGFLV